MEYKEFAYKRLGQKVGFTYLDYAHWPALVKHNAGIIVGYTESGALVIDVSDGSGFNLSDPLLFDMVLLQEPQHKSVWVRKIAEVTLLEPPPSYQKSILAYPHTCKHCKAPARQAKKFILCSKNCRLSKKSLHSYIGKIEPFKGYKCCKDHNTGLMRCARCKVNIFVLSATFTTTTYGCSCLVKDMHYSPTEGDVIKNMAGVPIIYKNDRWQYC